MNLKRHALLSALVALVLGLVAAGCGSSSNNGGASGSSGESVASTPPASSGTSGGGTSAAAPLKVCLITDIGGLNDRSFNHLAYVGVQRAKNELGVQTRVLESHSNSDYVPNLQTCGQQGYDLIFSVGFLLGDQTHQAAQAFPDSKFGIIDYAYPDNQQLPNLQGLVFAEQESGYLAGYLAGLVTKTNTVSSVGGQKIPPVDHYIAGFQKGAQDANPNVKVLNGYSQSFTDQAACKEIALDQLSKGSDVVFQVAGGCGLGALDAAKEKGVWGIGVDADQSYLGSYILTSAVKKVDVAVFDTIKEATQGQWNGGTTTLFSLKNNGTGLGKISPKVPQATVKKVMALIPKIKSGEIQIPTEVK